MFKILKLTWRQDLKLEFGQFFSADVLKHVESKMNLGRDSEARWRG